MSSEENLEVLPTDLILQIFSRLPSKTIARCRCLSKLWASLLTIGFPYFMGLFLTQSRTRPRLLFAVEKYEDEWCLYSCPQPQISSTNSKSSISVTAEFHMSLPKSDSFVDISPSVLGLMYFYDMPDLNTPTLCNPSTRQLFSLPQLANMVQSYFGYDPIDKQFNVLAITYLFPSHPPFVGIPLSYQILKLGSGRLSWRTLNCPLQHHPFDPYICINGVLYYVARLVSTPLFKIVCFDLNSKEFKFIDKPCDSCRPELLVNFKGKLGAINAKWVHSNKKRFHHEPSLWVLEDIEKQEWSKHVLDILPTKLWNKNCMSYCIVGMTAMSDVVLTHLYTTNPLYVYFFNLEKKTLQEVEIKGFEFCNRHSFRGCVDYVEELRALKWS